MITGCLSRLVREERTSSPAVGLTTASIRTVGDTTQWGRPELEPVVYPGFGCYDEAIEVCRQPLPSERARGQPCGFR